MSQPVDREGVFRAEIKEFGIKESDSGAVGISIKAELTEFWNGAEWEPWTEYGMEAIGDVWIVKKDKSINQSGTESLIRYAGWDGDILSIVNATWQPTPIAVVIKADEYKGNVRYRVEFVNDYSRVPGGLSMVSPEKANELKTRYGSQLRAIAGNVQRNAAPIQPSKPPAPVAPPTPPAPAMASTCDADEQIPF